MGESPIVLRITRPTPPQSRTVEVKASASGALKSSGANVNNHASVIGQSREVVRRAPPLTLRSLPPAVQTAAK
jgi:hypothetical protein